MKSKVYLESLEAERLYRQRLVAQQVREAREAQRRKLEAEQVSENN